MLQCVFLKKGNSNTKGLAYTSGGGFFNMGRRAPLQLCFFPEEDSRTVSTRNCLQNVWRDDAESDNVSSAP
jgi:hypothetical protein